MGVVVREAQPKVGVAPCVCDPGPGKPVDVFGCVPSAVRTGTGPQVMAALRNAAIGALQATGITNIAPPTDTTPATGDAPSPSSASPDDFAVARGVPLRAQVGLTLNGGDGSVGLVLDGFRIATMKQIEEPLPFRLGDAFRDGLTGRGRGDGGQVAQ
jgi:hypothetical protein